MAKSTAVTETPEPAPLDPIILARETMTGDIRDFILDRLKHDHNALPWNMRQETDQRNTVQETESAVRRLVAQAIETIVAAGQPVLRGVLTKLAVKDGIKAEVLFSQYDAMRHELIDHQGKVVMVSIASADEFSGERAPVKIEPDQKSLGEEYQDQ